MSEGLEYTAIATFINVRIIIVRVNHEYTCHSIPRS